MNLEVRDGLDEASGVDVPRRRYLASCEDLSSAIATLESSLVAFVGREEGIKVRVSDLLSDRLGDLFPSEAELLPPFVYRAMFSRTHERGSSASS